MSKVIKLEPLCYRKEEYEGDVLVDVEYNGSDSFSGGRTGGIPLVPVAQAEAYSNERVLETLKTVVAAIEAQRTSGTIRNGMIEACVYAVTALIPKQ